jgi:large subunit ribosomal protein LP1
VILTARSREAYLTVSSQAEKILAITNAADVEFEPIWATLLAKALEGKNVKELLSNVGSGGGAPAVGAPAASGGAPAATAEAPAEEKKKEEEKEESDEDMVRVHFLSLLSAYICHDRQGFGLFD